MLCCVLGPRLLPQAVPQPLAGHPCSGSRSPNPRLLMGCAHIYAGEMVIDVIKHAVLGKFNEIRWGGGERLALGVSGRLPREGHGAWGGQGMLFHAPLPERWRRSQ